MKKRTAVLASAAALSLTGCSMFNSKAPATQPGVAAPRAPLTTEDADRMQAKIDEMASDLRNRKKTTEGETPTAANVLPGVTTRPAAAPQPEVRVSDVIPPTTQPAGSAAMGTMAAGSVEAAMPRAEPTMEELITMLKKRVAASPKALPTALALELLNLGTNGKTDDLTKLGLSNDDNKVLSDIASAVQLMSGIAPGNSLAERANPLIKATKTWEADAALKLPKIALASRVDSFGVYTPVDNKFPSGKRSVVIIYVEVANFTTQKSGEFFNTSLSQQDTLVAEDGLIAWRSNFEDIDDRCRNQRKDFYLIKKLNLPETLSAGKYTLRMQINDKLGNKTDTATLEIEITK